MIAVTHPQPDDMTVLAMVMLWFSAICSAIVDNIPFVATMNPILIDLSNQVFGSAATTTAQARTIDPVWWALALGACLGGNGSPIGASANVIVIGLSEKAGHNISFGQFLKYGLPTMFLTIILSMIYLYLRYYVLQWF
jgi:Na+/H+ antiporter NhaD/arsenite permease-like protein